MRGRPLTILVCVAGLSAGGWSAARANGPTFIPGDLIVKFTAASELGARVARAMRDDRSAEREYAALTDRLSKELGVSVTAVRVTSGRELVLSVDRERLVKSLTAAIRRDPAVRAVNRVDAPKTVLPAARLELVLDLRRDSEAGQLVQRSKLAGEPTGREIDALVQRLCAGFDPLPSGRVIERDRLNLVIDIAKLTLELIDRLRRRPDVEYAQPIQILKPVGGK